MMISSITKHRPDCLRHYHWFRETGKRLRTCGKTLVSKKDEAGSVMAITSAQLYIFWESEMYTAGQMVLLTIAGFLYLNQSSAADSKRTMSCIPEERISICLGGGGGWS